MWPDSASMKRLNVNVPCVNYDLDPRESNVKRLPSRDETRARFVIRSFRRGTDRHGISRGIGR